MPASCGAPVVTVLAPNITPAPVVLMAAPVTVHTTVSVSALVAALDMAHVSLLFALPVTVLPVFVESTEENMPLGRLRVIFPEIGISVAVVNANVIKPRFRVPDTKSVADAAAIATALVNRPPSAKVAGAVKDKSFLV